MSDNIEKIGSILERVLPMDSTFQFQVCQSCGDFYNVEQGKDSKLNTILIYRGYNCKGENLKFMICEQCIEDIEYEVVEHCKISQEQVFEKIKKFIKTE